MKDLSNKEIQAVSGATLSEFLEAIEDGVKGIGHAIHDFFHNC